jgi:hypothetical protein
MGFGFSKPVMFGVAFPPAIHNPNSHCQLICRFRANPERNGNERIQSLLEDQILDQRLRQGFVSFSNPALRVIDPANVASL